MKRLLSIVSLSIAFALNCFNSSAQEIPLPVDNYGVYDYLDELANIRVISINSAVKPYSRLFIAKKLKEADKKREQLSLRQQKELDFYLSDFSKDWRRGEEGKRRQGAKATQFREAERGEEETINDGVQWLRGKNYDKRLDLFYYEDSLFSITVNPILGGEVFLNAGLKATYWRNGAEMHGYIHRFGFYASLSDNHEKPLLVSSDYLTRREGGHLKNGSDWSDMLGGITWSWKWGNTGLVRDRQVWGNNYNGANIFGGNNPAFVQLYLNLNPVKWFRFNYFHGWLNSMVVDSSRSYWVNNSYGPDYREVYHKKYIAANMFTFIPTENLYISGGNSIVYTDKHFNPAYIIPLFFYKSVDHAQTSGVDNMNSQMFLNVSSRNIKHLHLYASLFVDELSVKRFFEEDEWNFVSWKTGFRLDNFPFENLSFTTEFTYTYPLAFQHYVPTLTFETMNYNLGHYMKDNSREWYLALDYRPVRTLDIRVFLIDVVRGPDYTELGTDRIGNPPLASIEWQSTSFGLRSSYQIINDLYASFSLCRSNIRGDQRWSPAYLYGKKTTLNFGITFGF
ncbi:MAG: hypothetical protein JXN62_09925 [Bacteroidales bacterium]|nr:hypothetical protein [Bacteroidales bacterium]